MNKQFMCLQIGKLSQPELVGVLSSDVVKAKKISVLATITSG